MTDTTFEEARRCPACLEPGHQLYRRAAPPSAGMPQGTMVTMFECKNDRCPDYLPPQMAGGDMMKDSRYRWAVQTNPDGTVPPKGTGATGPKAFAMPGVHSSVAQRARDNLAFLAAQDERGPNSKEATEILRQLGGDL